MAVYIDAFTGTNATELHAYNVLWVAVTGAAQINTNAVEPTTGSHVGYRYNQTFAAAQYGKMKIVGSGNYGGPAIRMQSASVGFYYCYASVGANSYPGEMVAGTATDWDAGQASVVAGDIVELAVDITTSTTIYYKVNGVTIQTYTGKSALTGGQVGLAFFGGGSASRDDWEGGDVSAGASVRTLPVRSLRRPMPKQYLRN